MKFFSLIVGVLLAGVSLVAEIRPQMTDMETRLDFVDPPRISGVGSTSKSYQVTGANSRWAELEIRFYPVVLEGKKKFSNETIERHKSYRSGKKRNNQRTVNYSKYRRVTGMWLDDIVLQVRIVLLDKRSKKHSGYSEISGQCTFWSMAMDDRLHRVSMLVPPQLLDRLMPSDKSHSGVSSRAAQRNDVVAEVIFFHKSYGVIGETYFGLKNRELADSRREFKAKRKTVQQRNIFEGGIVHRSRTPWGLGESNNYDLIKPDTIPAMIDPRQNSNEQ